MKTHRVLTGQANLRYRKIQGVFYSCTGLLDAVLQPRILDNRLFLNVDFDSNGFFWYFREVPSIKKKHEWSKNFPLPPPLSNNHIYVFWTYFWYYVYVQDIYKPLKGTGKIVSIRFENFVTSVNFYTSREASLIKNKACYSLSANKQYSWYNLLILPSIIFEEHCLALWLD